MIIVNNISQKEKRRLLRKNQTLEENLIWKFLRRNSLGMKWRRQVSIGPYIADFYCREKRLVIEIDGVQHAEAVDYDREREYYFLALGIKTIRFWNYEINENISLVYEKILSIIINSNNDDEDPLKVNF